MPSHSVSYSSSLLYSHTHTHSNLFGRGALGLCHRDRGAAYQGQRNRDGPEGEEEAPVVLLCIVVCSWVVRV